MENLKARHAISFGVLFSIGGLIISLGYNNEYIWQTLIITFLMSLFFIIIYQKMLDNYPNMNLFEIIQKKYNNVLGKILITLYLILLTYSATCIIYTFIDFITTINQSDFLSKELIMLINLLLLGYVLKNSLINIARFSQITFVIIIFMVIVLFILGINDINFQNLLPIVSFSNNKQNNILDLVIQPFLESTILFNVLCKMEKSKIKKYIMPLVSFISLIVLLLISIETVGLLGNKYAAYLNYPYYSSISCVDISKIVIKIESLSLIIFYFSSFIKLIIVMHSIMLGFSTLTNTKKKYYYPFLTFIHVLSMVIFDNIYQLFDFNKYYNVFAFLVITIIPIMISFKNNEKNNIMHNT